MNDVHYYLENLKLKIDGMCYLSGGLFSLVMGYDIELPLGLGRYNCIPKYDNAKLGMCPLWIEMNTLGNNQVYDHPFTWIHNVEFLINYGWYMHFAHV